MAAILAAKNIVFKKNKFTPLPYSKEVLERFVIGLNVKKENFDEKDAKANNVSITPTKQKSSIEQAKNVKSNESSGEKLSWIDQTNTHFLFKYKLIEAKFPYNFLKHNKQLFDELKSEVETLFSASLRRVDTIYMIEFQIEKNGIPFDLDPSRLKSKIWEYYGLELLFFNFFFQPKLDTELLSNHERWSYHLTSFLGNFQNKYFAHYSVGGITSQHSFNYLLHKALSYYKSSQDVELKYLNEPNKWSIQIIGQEKLIDSEKKRIQNDVEFFNTNIQNALIVSS